MVGVFTHKCMLYTMFSKEVIYGNFRMHASAVVKFRP